DRFTQELADDLVLLAVVLGQIQLDLPARAGRQVREIADARYDWILTQQQAAPLGVADQVFQIGDRHADADAGLLVDRRAGAGQPGHLFEDLLHEGRRDDSDPAFVRGQPPPYPPFVRGGRSEALPPLQRGGSTGALPPLQRGGSTGAIPPLRRGGWGGSV